MLGKEKGEWDERKGGMRAKWRREGDGRMLQNLDNGPTCGKVYLALRVIVQEFGFGS